ncbi:MarR family winged helix-turn-helix transcriptional regulator [Zooshikella sp. RANM57]|uniref:MarR family winged helix-turn-helix transcriptional regulator n=1 Tax=Zooshikella sp. RANM57 TaxID=3425863 RepID=UPI003D6E53D0
MRFSEIDVLDESIFFAVSSLHYVMRQKITLALEPLNITSEMLGSMLIIADKGPLTTNQFCCYQGRGRSTSKRIIDRLQQRQLIALDDNECDKRVKNIRLLPAGEKLLKQGLQAIQQARQALEKKVGTKQLTQFMANVREMYTLLQDDPE